MVIAISTTTFYGSSTLLEDGVNDQLNILVQEKASMLQEIIKNSQATGHLIAINPEIVKYLYSTRNVQGLVPNPEISQYLAQIFDSGN
jgi:hypothetical protein